MSIRAHDYLSEVAAGQVPGRSLVRKFGRNAAIGTSFAPISLGGIYPMPQPAGAVALRVKAGGNAGDTAAGAGAQEVTFEGLSPTGALIQEAVATAGASASAATTLTFMRLFRAWVSDSGTYASVAGADSHVADIVIEDSGGVGDWGTISAANWKRSQTLIGCYSIPLACYGILLHAHVTIESNKAAAVLLVKRENILEAAAPYTAMRELEEYTGLTGGHDLPLEGPHYLAPLSDLAFLAKVPSTTADVSVVFDLLLVDA